MCSQKMFSNCPQIYQKYPWLGFFLNLKKFPSFFPWHFVKCFGRTLLQNTWPLLLQKNKQFKPKKITMLIWIVQDILEVYLEIVENLQRLLILNYFPQKSSFTDIRLGSKYAYAYLVPIDEVQFKFLCKRLFKKYLNDKKYFLKHVIGPNTSTRIHRRPCSD